MAKFAKNLPGHLQLKILSMLDDKVSNFVLNFGMDDACYFEHRIEIDVH